MMIFKKHISKGNQLSILAIITLTSLAAPNAEAGGSNEDVPLEVETVKTSTEIAESEGGVENASNPLAKVKYTDVRWQYQDTENGTINNYSIEGAFMATDKLKLKYELHYWDTDISGKRYNGWESLDLKAIYFPTEGKWGDVSYRVAAGVDWIIDLGDLDKGIGIGSDQIAPFGGLALTLPNNMSVIPLIQQFLSYSGEKVNTTAFRLIAMKPLPNNTWLKLDAIAPFDWEDDGAIRGTSEIQLGKDINESLAIYSDVLIGFGGGKTYDWGLGLGLRFKY